jgi:hypothetical protein
MTEPVTALVCVGFGAAPMLCGIVHMRWLDRKLYNPYPKKPKVTP